MTEAQQAGGESVAETTVAPESHAQAPSTTPESGSDSTNKAENVIASEPNQVAPEKDEAWYRERNKQLTAEAARKSDKIKQEREKVKSLEARLEKLQQSVPTLESVGGDYDKLAAAQQDHRLRTILAEEKLSDVSLSSEGVRNDGLEAVQKANEAYVQSIQGYFGGENAVNPQAYQSKEAVFNEALLGRSEHEQAMIINELAKMPNAPEVIMNVADNPEALYKLRTEPSMFQIGSVLNNAKQPRATSAAPPPVPDVDGKTGAISGEHDMSTIEGVRAWRKENGLR